MGAENAALAAVMKALDELFVLYFNAGDVDRLVATCYAEDALVLPPNAPLVRGRGQIRELFRELIEAGMGDVSHRTLPLYAEGDLAYGIGTNASITRAPGARPIRETGKHLLVYLRQSDGAWRVAVEMFNSDLPMQLNASDEPVGGQSAETRNRPHADGCRGPPGTRPAR
jgi:ketosteroid isomerase-like protein